MFRGYDTTRERLVAVKLFRIDIPPERAHQLVDGLERLIAANLSHPALAKPIATGITGVSAYLASDYVAADSFDLTIRELGRPSAVDALQVAARIAGALDQAAEAGVTHGCLHPRDVLMSSKETRLTGIGVGQALAEIGVPAPVRRPYAAPERLADVFWDRRADIFSLAALVHELLWGRRVAGIGAQAVEGLGEVAGGNLDALKTAFARALAEDPAERHPTAAAFVNALKRALPDVVTPTAAAAEPERAAPGSRAVVAHVRPQEDAESLLPLEPLRFTDVDDESDVGRSGPSIIESDDDAGAHRQVALVEEPNEPEPLVLSWMSPPPHAPKPAVPDVAADRNVDAPAAAAPLSSTVSVAESAKPSPPEPPKVSAPEPPRRAPVRAEPPAPGIAQPSLLAREDDSPPREAPAVRLSLGGNVEPAPGDANMLERSRSALWPLLLALVVGATLGFAGGYAVGVRDRPPSPVSTTAAAVPQAPGREFTEGTIPAPPKAAAADEVRPKTEATEAKTEAPIPAAGNAVRRGSAPVPAPPARGVPPKADLKGRLNIRSMPAGARIFVDDREVGRTPAAVRELAEGPHVVRVLRDGYAAADRRIVLTRERPVQAMAFTLERVRVPAARGAQPARAVQAPPPAPVGQGSLVVDSRPAGARVFFDGRPLGTTPFSTGGLPAGDHTIRLELDGYRAWLASVRIVATEQARISASLER